MELKLRLKSALRHWKPCTEGSKIQCYHTMCLCTGVLKPRTADHTSVLSTPWYWAQPGSSLTHTQWLAGLIFAVWEHNTRSEPQVTAWFHSIFPKEVTQLPYFHQGWVKVNPSLLSFLPFLFLDLSFGGWPFNSFKLSLFSFTSSTCSPKLLE